MPMLLLLAGGVLIYAGFKGEDPRDLISSAFGRATGKGSLKAKLVGANVGANVGAGAGPEQQPPTVGGNVGSAAPGAMTPGLSRIVAAVRREFPKVTVQTFACRKIAGSSSWSQHAYANAADIFLPNWPESLDPVHAFLKRNESQLGGYCELIFRQTAGGSPHLNHIHVSAKPCRSGTPPCAGGN